ncbi:hypothetical protein BLX88_02895, partial [Bacillus obstructivus]
LVLGADENAHARSRFGQIEQLYRAFLGLEIIEQMAQPVEIRFGVDGIQKVPAPAHDEPGRLAATRAAPDRKSLLDQVLRQDIERLLGFVLQAGNFHARFGDGAALNMRIEEIRCFDQLRWRHAGRQVDHPVFNVAALGHQHRQR